MMKDITKQKKSIILNSMVLTVSCLIIVATGNIAGADVGGSCNDCHTMHYSQGGTIPPEFGTDGQYPRLLQDTCIGCHSTTNDDPRDDTYHTPFIKGTGLNDNNCLAGGFFTDDVTMEKNHDDNSHTLGSTETPAGYDPARSGGDWYRGDEGGDFKFTCAGATGCHGDQTSLTDAEAIHKGHHNIDSTYRMLYVDGAPVVGKGSSDYEEALIANPTQQDAEYNVYSAGDNEVTISEFCEKCHGSFHQDSTPFVRHPTNIDIPQTWAIVDDDGTVTNNSNYDNIDRVNNPLGFAGADETKVGRVTCLSCHRAHGTGNKDLLRFDYDLQISGSGEDTGCLACHDSQR